MAIADWFKQRVVEEDAERRGARVPSRLPSGPQRAGSTLVAALIEQLAFGIQIADCATHVLAPTACGPVEVDVFLESRHDVDTGAMKWAILVEDTPERSAAELAALREWCRHEGVDLRVMAASDVLTTFLTNVRLLAHTRGHPPDAMDPTLRPLFKMTGPNAVPTTVADATDALTEAGFASDHVRLVIDGCVASGLVACDLKLPYGEQAVLTPIGYGYDDLQTNRRDPALVAIMAARPG